jgi:hypothetical protein
MKNSMHSLARLLQHKTTSRRMRKVDENLVPDDPHEVRLFMVVRNESLRLPAMLKYYFSKGIDRIFAIDNGSTDGTLDLLLSQKKAHVFATKDTYKRHPYWIDFLLCRYGAGHWCIVIDADEILIYPHFEKISIRQLCTFLGREGYNIMDFFLLDMYPDRPLAATSYKKGDGLISAAPYFDTGPYYTEETLCPGILGGIKKSGSRFLKSRRMYGGMRKRVFGIEACLSKFPLFKFERSMSFASGMHLPKGAHLAFAKDLCGALLHFKFLNDFPARAAEEVARKEHWRGAAEYRAYVKAMDRDPHINFYHPRSVRFADSGQLTGLGIMKSSPAFDDFVKNGASL